MYRLFGQCVFLDMLIQRLEPSKGYRAARLDKSWRQAMRMFRYEVCDGISFLISFDSCESDVYQAARTPSPTFFHLASNCYDLRLSAHSEEQTEGLRWTRPVAALDCICEDRRDRPVTNIMTLYYEARCLSL